MFLFAGMLNFTESGFPLPTIKAVAQVEVQAGIVNRYSDDNLEAGLNSNLAELSCKVQIASNCQSMLCGMKECYSASS
jgi:hypothetical protein